MKVTVTVTVTAPDSTEGIPAAIAYALDNPLNYPDDVATEDWGVSVYDPDGSKPEPVTQDPETMPAHIHGETVVSAFRHGPLYGELDDTYTVITRDGNSPAARYSVSRARFAPLLGRWSIDTSYAVDSGLTWTAAASEFAERVTQRVS